MDRDFYGRCWTQGTGWKTQDKKKDFDPKEYGLNVLDINVGAPGLSTDPGLIHGGSNSGYQAVGLAFHLGATDIWLLGYDMQLTDNRAHFFGDHPPEIRNGGDPKRFVSNYRTINPGQYGINIVNCSRETALDMFPRSTIDDV